MKKFIYGALAGLVIGTAVYIRANDNVRQGSGVSRTSSMSRWQHARVGSEPNTGSTATTNVVTTVSSVIGKVVFNSAEPTASIQIFDATTGASASAARRVFVSLGNQNSPTAANSPTMANSPSLSGSYPLIYDLMPGLSCTNGITTIITRVSTPTFGGTADLMWDTVISDTE